MRKTVKIKKIRTIKSILKAEEGRERRKWHFKTSQSQETSTTKKILDAPPRAVAMQLTNVTCSGPLGSATDDDDDDDDEDDDDDDDDDGITRTANDHDAELENTNTAGADEAVAAVKLVEETALVEEVEPAAIEGVEVEVVAAAAAAKAAFEAFDCLLGLTLTASSASASALTSALASSQPRS